MRLIIDIPEGQKLTGNDVCSIARVALENVRYNIGPEPVRETTGRAEHEGTELATWTLQPGEAVFGRCSLCGKPIEYSGNVWRHIGFTPRHPAVPKQMRGAA